jgi:hypothetical protein
MHAVIHLEGPSGDVLRVVRVAVEEARRVGVPVALDSGAAPPGPAPGSP